MTKGMDIIAIREELAQALRWRFDGIKGVAVYGAGDTAERWLAPFGDGNLLPDYFIDDTPGKSGTFLYNRPVISFEEAHTLCKSFLILPCSILPSTRKAMEKSLLEVPIDGARYCAVFDEYVFSRHANMVLTVYDMLEDDLSKATYANMILTRMGRAAQDQDLVLFGQNYFGIVPFINCNIHEVFVDCGAYVGDTLEQFLTVRAGMFHRIFAFEPFEKSFQAMKARTERLTREWGLENHQIELVQAGIGDRAYNVELKTGDYADGTALSEESAHGDIPVISIDKYFEDQPITFLKADIEGYEWKMLHGAEQVIKRDQPKLAVCIYHFPSDMYRIALKIKEICPEYKLAMRQHSYTFNESVLYAYI